ncbi:MAG: RNA polymerase sigma factor [Bacteroidetes bacterium]|nr:MAG: RNA polymerase sigma factor [Bacteroidota bacterium]
MSTTEFNHLVLETSEALKPFAVSLTRDNEQAKDLYQETLYKAFANKDKYNIGTNIKAWLYTIMRNTFINEYRRRVSRNIVFHDPTADYQLFNIPDLTFNNTESNILFKDIQKKVNNLPCIFRHPFKLYFEGYKYHEIAYIMNEPLGTIKSRIHFARKLLKEQIERN